MTEARGPIYSVADFPDLFVTPVRSGRPPSNDDAAIETVRLGVADGKFKSAEQAAYVLSNDYADEYKADAFRRRIAPKLSHLFS